MNRFCNCSYIERVSEKGANFLQMCVDLFLFFTCSCVLRYKLVVDLHNFTHGCKLELELGRFKKLENKNT